MPKTDYRAAIKFIATSICALWMAVTVYQQFFDVNPAQYGFRSPEIEQKMKTCTGTFEERYKCKEDLIIDKGHQSFLIWLEKIALIFGPPLVLWGLINRATREGDASPQTEPESQIARRRSR